MKFDATGDKFTWAPRLSAQFSPDKLASDNKFNIGSRWSVRGFDGWKTACPAIRDGTGATILSGIWPPTSGNSIWARDIGRLIGADLYQKGKVLSGAVSGCAVSYGQRSTICLLVPR
ncbi:putative hemolysin activator HlyB [Klebsiella pneumoniae]|uniref:Putative hemolysin activator HlyB n=1 Tax=Klebsiella pneumoniae TaxID=573 RepID=A0A3S4HZ99_KLEPN|nr:putative hemolysin activator HlyB [Klebsiella pneumoniae]